MADALKREVEIRAAYDKRPEYGQHCVDMCFYLKGSQGIVQFIIFTGWYKQLIGTPDTPWQQLRIGGLGRDIHRHEGLTLPMAADLGYHSPTPRYDGQSSMECHLMPEGKCYYDGSGLNAERIFSIMLHEGGEAMWKALEEYYREIFETTIVPVLSSISNEDGNG